MKSGFIKKADIILGAALLIIGVLSVVWVAQKPNETDRVQIMQDGRVIYDELLSLNGRLVISAGDGSNTVVIEDSAVWVEDADCNGRDCVGFGKIEHAGQLIMCLPHRLLITIKGGDGVDAVLY